MRNGRTVRRLTTPDGSRRDAAITVKRNIAVISTRDCEKKRKAVSDIEITIFVRGCRATQ
jgi:3-deoxy-D-manno-octulosonate 8-phosphate phosphatase KdsC-like HAD superfamily phosphatase